jgi:aspartate/methionine/tyrosine aminotransferase
MLAAGLNVIRGMPYAKAHFTFLMTAFGRSSNWLAEYLLEETGVAVLPGTSFGKNGEGYLRLCFANSMENILEALERMKPALAAAASGP